MAPLRTVLFLLICFTITQATLSPLYLKLMAAKHRAMMAARHRKPIIRRPIITKPIIRRPIIRKPVVRLVKVPIFVPKLIGLRGLGIAKGVTNLLNPLAPSRHYATIRSSDTPSKSSERPKIEKTARAKSQESSENSSGHWADKIHKDVHPVDRPRQVTRSLLSRAFRSFINHDEHSLRNLGPLFQPAHHTLSAAGSIVLPHPSEDGVGQPLEPLLFHQWPSRRP